MEHAVRITGRLASSCRAINPNAEDTPLTTIAPASARNRQAIAEAASPKRLTMVKSRYSRMRLRTSAAWRS